MEMWAVVHQIQITALLKVNTPVCNSNWSICSTILALNNRRQDRATYQMKKKIKCVQTSVTSNMARALNVQCKGEDDERGNGGKHHLGTINQDDLSGVKWWRWIDGETRSTITQIHSDIISPIMLHQPVVDCNKVKCTNLLYIFYATAIERWKWG